MERVVDELARELSKVVGSDDPLTIVPYIGFGDEERAFLKARVLEERGVEQPPEDASPWENLGMMLRRYASEEIGGARVEARWPGGQTVKESDEEGFVDFELDLEDAAERGPFVDVRLQLLEPLRHDESVEVKGEVLVPPPSARFGVISDVDDTILQTGATTLFKHWRTVLTSNAATRVPFAGLPELYRALRDGSAEEGNPIFYVSSSPWNIYDLFVRYLEIRDIPRGPFFLKDFGLDEDKWFTGSHDAHKRDAIDRILKTYPHLPFILVGDSGQRDAEIYRDVVANHPGRIQAVYLRDVTADERDAEVREVLRGIEQQGVAIAYSEDLAEAADDALERGWISEASHAEVRAAVTR